MVHPHSVLRKVRQRLFNLRKLKKIGLAAKTLMNFYRCTIESILSGCITAWYGNCTARNRKALPEGGVVCPTLHREHTACPPGHLQHLMSQEGQKDHQGHQPPDPRPVHPAIIQKARSVQVHQSWDRETEKQLLSQGHPTVKWPSLASYNSITQHCTLEAADYVHRHGMTGHFKWNTSYFNHVYIVFYSFHMYILYSTVF